MGGEYAGRKDMMVYIALCDARWNIRKVIRSIPACLPGKDKTRGRSYRSGLSGQADGEECGSKRDAAP